jgi:hypothetical protein
VDSPAFGIEQLANGRGVFGVLFKNEDGHLTRFSAVVGVPLSIFRL